MSDEAGYWNERGAAHVSVERVLTHLREQIMHCAALGSPFTAQLCECFAEDLLAGGPVADLVGGWPTSPRADVVGLRLAGALHAAVLMQKDSALAGVYPRAADAWDMTKVWPLARAFLLRERAWVADFIRSPPQTNETRRAIGLLAAFLAFAETWRGPFDMLELGASAGLNLNWDRFRYETASWSWGPQSPVTITTEWSGPPPPLAPLHVRRRAGCDLNPLDIRDPEQRLRLRSYIWPDQPDRLERFDGAVALALQADTRVARADAAEWLKAKLAARSLDGATIVYHSVFLQYPPQETRLAIADALTSEGANARPEAPLVWVRSEPEALIDGVRGSIRKVIDYIAWPGGVRRVLGHADGHLRAFEASASDA